MALKLQQFKHETDSWKRMLEFIQQENVYLKTRLAEALKRDVKSDFLERAEYFQTGFLHLDDRISFLRRDITELNKTLLSELFHDGHLKELAQKQKRLRRDVETEEQYFNKLRNEFNSYLTDFSI